MDSKRINATGFYKPFLRASELRGIANVVVGNNLKDIELNLCVFVFAFSTTTLPGVTRVMECFHFESSAGSQTLGSEPFAEKFENVTRPIEFSERQLLHHHNYYRKSYKLHETLGNDENNEHVRSTFSSLSWRVF